MSVTTKSKPFSIVLVGVDGASAGRDAIALAANLIEPDGKLILAHVHEGELTPRRASNLDYDAVQRDDSKRLLEAERASLAYRPP